MNSRRDIEEIYTARDDTDADEFRDAYEETRRSYEFGVLTHTLRKAAGLTQKELATRMGTTASAIARLEAGGPHPTFGTLEARRRAGRAAASGSSRRHRPPAVTFGAA